MTSSSKPSLPLSKVPSVRQLCEELGFQHASLKDTNTFMEAVHAWRKSYQTSSGRPATEILHWNRSSDQIELEEMAQAFLDERGGKGAQFWSPERSWNHDSDLQLPADRAQIVALLKQLFWKQNRYAFNNTQYAHKDSESRDQSRESTTPARQIDRALAGGGVSAPLASSAPTTSGSTQLKPKSPKFQSICTTTAALDERSRKPRSAGSATTGGMSTSNFDIYEVPDDSDSNDETLSCAPKRPHPPPSSNASSPRKKKKKYHLAEPLRRTDRKRAIRSFPHTVPNDQIEQLINDGIEARHRTEPSSAAGSFDHTPPRFTTKDAETNSENPLPLAPPVAGRTAPVAPMMSPDIHKSASPQSNASRVLQVTNHPDWGQDTAPSSPRNDTTTKAMQPKPSEPASSPRMEPVLERERRGSRTSRSPPFSPSAHESGIYALAQSTTTSEAGHIGPSSGIDHSKLILSPRDALLHSKSSKSAIHRPAAEQFPSSPEASPSPSVNDFGRSENRQDQPREVSDGFKSLAGLSEAAPTKQSRLETSSHGTETVSDEINGSITATNRPQAHERKEAKQDSTPEPSSAKPRQKTQIPLWIITREPRYTEERWDDGKFMGTPLPAFIEGISKVTQRRHIEKIKLTLRAPTFDTKITVYRDAEDSWASAKETFIEKLREAKAEARAKRQTENLTFKILVEPFYEEGTLPSGGIDEDEEEKKHSGGGTDCTGLWTDYQYCVRDPSYIDQTTPTITSTSTSKPSSTTKTTSTGSTPTSPVQAGQPTDCNKWYMAKNGDDCSTVESAYSLTHAQFLARNPAVSSDCESGLWGGYGYCVGIASKATTSSTSKPPTTTSKTSSTTTSVAIPSPTQAGIISTCKKYAMTQNGDWCTLFADRYSIPYTAFYKWNTVLGSNGENCGSSFWAGEYYCNWGLVVK